MKLRVFARPGHVLPYPGQRTAGQIRRYIGRESKSRDGVISHRAKEEPTEIDDSSDAGRMIVRLFLQNGDKPLVPAEEETAKRLGVKFVPGKVVGGEWDPDAPVDEQKEARERREARRKARLESLSPKTSSQGQKTGKANDK